MAARIRWAAIGVFALAANAVGLLPAITASTAGDDIAMCKGNNSICTEGDECCGEICEIENGEGRCKGAAVE
jgi:hypothetical protein